jgi:transcriptional regulator with XRE-family HTH domain
MKEKDLYVEFESQQLVYYVEKDDESYGPIVSGSHLSANYLDDFFKKKKNLEIKLRKELVDGKISPLFYYMTLQEIGPKDLAKRIGVSYRKLKKLYHPDSFKKLKIEKLLKISDTFNITVSQLFQTFLIKDTDQKKIVIEQSSTKNDLFNIVKVYAKYEQE